MADVPVPYFDGKGEVFERHGIMNGVMWWFATDLMRMLGYETFASFKGAINKAIGTCMTLGIAVEENFVQFTRIDDGQSIPDYKLSRFACYLTTMNGDVKKPQVAKAQAYFAGLADAARQYAENVNEVERVQVRDEISDREQGLSGAAKLAGVENYAFFRNAGYRGMYNMDLNQLKRLKGLEDLDRSLLDFMGKRELVGNLFRLTETEARLKNERVRGQKPAEAVAQQVGAKVRGLMRENGDVPERLPLETDIREVRRSLKQTAKQLKQLDGRNALPAAPAVPDSMSAAWLSVVEDVLKKKPMLGAVLSQARPSDVRDGELTITVTGNHFHRELLASDENRELVTRTIQRHFAGVVQFSVR